MDIFPVIVGGVTSLLVTVVGFVTATKLGVGTSQLHLVSTLKDLVTAQSSRIEQLEAENKDKDDRIASLERKVADLEDVVIHLNVALTKKKNKALGEK